MLRKCTDEDISDEKCEKIIDPLTKVLLNDLETQKRVILNYYLDSMIHTL